MAGLATSKSSAQVRRKRDKTTGDGERDDSMAEIQRRDGRLFGRRAVTAMLFRGNIDRYGWRG
jgi:hypothetical protein